MTKSTLQLLAVVTAAAITASSAFAQTQPAPAQPPVDHSKMDHSKMGHSAPAAGTAAVAASTKAFQAANDKMHSDMAITYSGNADVDFIKGMLPHHQGAVDMAKIVLQHGKDAKVRKLARDIIKAQNTEIAFMKTWLAQNAK
jgi:uncharacterized protein (DUF305 family)